MNNEEFFIQWKDNLDKMFHILNYLQTYPSLLAKLKIDDLITSDELIKHQNDWINLYSQYDGKEADFFKPYWIPIQRTSYSYFLDMSDKKYPVFETSFFPFEPYDYTKTILFDSITDFMLLEDNRVNIEELRQNKLDELIEQSKNKFIERNILAYSGKLKIEKPSISEISKENNRVTILQGEELTNVICKNTTSIIIGLLPFDLELEIENLEIKFYTPDDELLDYASVKTIRDLTHYIRSNGLLRIENYFIKINSINTTAKFKNGQFEIISQPNIIKDFAFSLKKIL